MNRIEINRSNDILSLETWIFVFLNGNLFLDSYSLKHKASTRHKKYSVIKRYERLFRRNSNIVEAEVPINDGIKEEALNRFVGQIKVLKWSEK
jgi:hypothetical protein